jgi:hypothetical protein
MDTAAAQIALRKAKRSLHGGMYRRIKAVAPIATRAASIKAREESNAAGIIRSG